MMYFISDSCTWYNGGCDVNAECTHRDADFAVVCGCRKGYTKVGTEDVVKCKDSCYENNGECGPNAQCSHESGTFAVVCKCQVGYINSGSDSTLSCIDSCKRDNGGCQPGAVCSHDPVTFAVVCGCPDGFVNSGCGADSKCVDVCEVKNGGCDPNAACSHGGLKNAVVCTCKKGYTPVASGSVTICVQATTTLAPGTQKAFLKVAHMNSMNPGFQTGQCPSSPDGRYGWHLLLQGTSTSFVSISCLFKSAGVVTSMIQTPTIINHIIAFAGDIWVDVVTLSSDRIVLKYLIKCFFEEDATSLVNYITAYQILFAAWKFTPNINIFIHMTANDVDIVAIQLCKTIENLNVFGTASESKHYIIKRNGVDIILDPLNEEYNIRSYDLLEALGRRSIF
ncbi:unnamed protein product [Rotaria sp. Silwood1]|nr:unnamed protein product [Rotaria sp. Silwood1]CAF1632769.1 unnamed protein product [Rotaria sp. Silwood1]